MPKGIPGSYPPCAIEGCTRLHEAKGWCATHYVHWKRHGHPVHVPPTVSERFWVAVEKEGPPSDFAPHLGACWLWTLSPNAYGYGQFAVGTKPDGRQLHRLAYNWSWEEENGPIPDGLVLDHLCRVTLCVRPSHLEAVTYAENSRRGLQGVLKTHCINGHLRSADNLIVRKDGTRRCRICVLASATRSRERKRLTKAA